MANMHAPLTLHRPSAALLPAAATLMVNEEQIQISCQKQCTVSARYLITSRQPVNTSLRFVLADTGPVRAEVNGQPAPVSLEAASPPATPEHGDQAPRIETSDTLHEAVFPARFRPGTNRVTIHYRQQPGLNQRSFGGYFTGWLSLDEFRYELWPLKEWRLASSFTLTLRAEFTLEDPERDAVLVCLYPTRDSRPDCGQILSATANPVLYRRQWSSRFPARIEWLFGDRMLIRDLAGSTNPSHQSLPASSSTNPQNGKSRR